jgi:hypothetical protein
MVRGREARKARKKEVRKIDPKFSTFKICASDVIALVYYSNCY